MAQPESDKKESVNYNQGAFKQQEKLMTDSLKEENECDKNTHLLITGFIHEFEGESKHIMIPKEIFIIILVFYPKPYEVLKFDEEYKSKKVMISDNGESATKAAGGNFWILSGGDAVKRGIAVWRLKVQYN